MMCMIKEIRRWYYYDEAYSIVIVVVQSPFSVHQEFCLERSKSKVSSRRELE